MKGSMVTLRFFFIFFFNIELHHSGDIFSELLCIYVECGARVTADCKAWASQGQTLMSFELKIDNSFCDSRHGHEL